MNFKETHFLCFLCVCTINLEGFSRQTKEKDANPICSCFYYPKTRVGSCAVTIDGRTYKAGWLNLINQTPFVPAPELKSYFYQQQILTEIDQSKSTFYVVDFGESSEITSISKAHNSSPENTTTLFIDYDLESSDDHFCLTEDFDNNRSVKVFWAQIGILEAV
ncbi:hypothetical protein [Pedobacter antarcticus]|uniref:hypothetical protein n=1 Tax=Pedobacter antarcticus TaxID=34086 RepID=UPI00292E26C6|nr:hypothetical protein [Pedobacter antarcticus]